MSADLSQSPRMDPLSAPLRAADIDEAAARIAGVVSRTPLEFSDRLSALTGADVYLKREDQQPV
ncbi:threonine dehydratase, partial [Mycobacterium sp. ITM-2017-0098]